jgi:hypothetical protein
VLRRYSGVTIPRDRQKVDSRVFEGFGRRGGREEEALLDIEYGVSSRTEDLKLEPSECVGRPSRSDTSELISEKCSVFLSHEASQGGQFNWTYRDMINLQIWSIVTVFVSSGFFV